MEPQTSSVEKHAGGRPTIFDDGFGERILELMASGLSLAAAAADLNIHRQRVYEWVEKHPEFADTIKLAMSKRQLFLERRLLSAVEGPVVTSSIFALKNAGAADWRDKVEQEINVKGDIASLIEARRQAVAALTYDGE
jgi:hypothetical protein